MRRAILLGAIGVLAFAAPALADPSADAPAKPRCFLSSQFENWKSPDPKTIYIRVNLHQYYRLDLAAECSALRWPGAFLITKIHGSSSICSALDWDLHVSESWQDIPQACIVKKMTELTPEEAAAIPPKYKP